MGEHQTSGDFSIALPDGEWRIAVDHGMEYVPMVETITVNGEWESRPFEPPVYWAVRAEAGPWGLELLHDKLYLRNPPPEVRSFGISHGLNFLTAQRSWGRASFDVRAGAGVVVAHPESEVRGRRESRYVLTGPVIGAGLGKRVGLGERARVDLEGRVTAARVRVPIADGEARTTNLALHLLVGIVVG